jgi:transcriptional regulator with XRE-family HTH domain
MNAPEDSLAGKNIRRFRLERDLSLSELARRANISKGYISNLERGEANARPSGETLYALAEALGVTMSDLLGRKLLVEQKQQIPTGLREFAKAEEVPEADVAMLAAIKFRGEQPQSMERWRHIYEAIRTSGILDKESLRND